MWLSECAVLVKPVVRNSTLCIYSSTGIQWPYSYDKLSQFMSCKFSSWRWRREEDIIEYGPFLSYPITCSVYIMNVHYLFFHVAFTSSPVLHLLSLNGHPLSLSAPFPFIFTALPFPYFSPYSVLHTMHLTNPLFWKHERLSLRKNIIISLKSNLIPLFHIFSILSLHQTYNEAMTTRLQDIHAGGAQLGAWGAPRKAIKLAHPHGSPDRTFFVATSTMLKDQDCWGFVGGCVTAPHNTIKL